MEKAGQLQIAQDRETPVQTGENAAFGWRYAYCRSTDTRLAEDAGQDYLVFRHDDQTFAFALCDGVSQSFFGDLAARFLGDALLEWVWESVSVGMGHEAIHSALDKALVDLATKSTEVVREHSLPQNVPWILRDVLEQKRAMGSQTTFICGRVDQPRPGLKDGRLLLAWLGDSRVRIWGPSGERTKELGDTFHTQERWSTLQGPIGSSPHVFTAPVRHDGKLQVARIMLYSDGLALLDPYSLPPSDAEVSNLIEQAGESPMSDDISFLDIQLRKIPDAVPEAAKPEAAKGEAIKPRQATHRRRTTR